MDKTQLKSIIIVIIIGTILGGIILTWERDTSSTVVDTKINLATSNISSTEKDGET